MMILMLLSSCNGYSKETKKVPLKNEVEASTGSATEPRDTPRGFVKNYGVNDNNRLFVFVGQKISVEPLPRQRYAFDQGFKAKYLVIEKVFGDFPSDTIEFVAYDHYGTPAFSKYKHVLLFVSADSGTYYHQKYMYNDVYKTKDGRWAGAYAVGDYLHEYNKQTKVKPVIIHFAERVCYARKIITEQGHTLTANYPKPYFKTVGDSAVAIYGNYVHDLFILKRDGFLTAREIFRNGELTK